MKKFLYFLPRVIVLLAIGFLSLFSFDVWSEQGPFWQLLAGFLIHLIPSFVLTLVLAFAWKYEIIGGAVFIGLSTAMFFYFDNPFVINTILFGSFLFAGCLFILRGIVFGKT